MLSGFSNNLLASPELLHPLFVHFPIALLLFAALAHVIRLFPIEMIQKNNHQIEFFYKACLYLSIPFLVLNIYLGDVAMDAAKALPEKLRFVQAHEDVAYRLLIAMAFVVLWEALWHYSNRFHKILNWVMLINWIIVCALLFQTGHSGAELVYLHGIGLQQ